MQHPTDDDLARDAIGLPAPGGLADHLDACPHCRARRDALRSLAGRLADAYGLDAPAPDGRARLLAALPEPAAPSRPASTNPVSLWKDPIVRRRLFTTAAAASLALPVAALWLAGSPRPALAMSQVAEAVRAAKSYQFNVTADPLPGSETPALRVTGRIAWMAPGSTREEMKQFDADGKMVDDMVEILPAGQPGLMIDHLDKFCVRRRPRLGRTSPLMMVEKLGAYSGSADRDLGWKDVTGVRAHGFAVDARKIDPDAGPMELEVWADEATNRPVLVRLTDRSRYSPIAMEMRDFSWDVAFDPSTFDPTPPPGYDAQMTGTDFPREEKLGEIVKALRTYAEFSGDHYPRVDMIYPDVATVDLARLAGTTWPLPPEVVGTEKGGKLYGALRGFSFIFGILRDEADASYHGKTVGPKDADKVLLQWRLDDGRHQVVYGDLRTAVEDAPKGP